MSTQDGWGPPAEPFRPGGYPAPGAYPVAPQRAGSTRTIAIVALVISLISLAALLLTQLVPMLLFGAIGFGGGDPFADGTVGGFSGNVQNGSVAVRADGSVDSAALATAVTAAGPGELPGTVTCDPVPKAGADVSVLCRGSGPDTIRSYAVVRFTDDAGRFQVMSFVYGE